METKFNKFYQKTIKKRHQIIEEHTGSSISGVNLPRDVADQMVENYLTNYELPLGIVTNFTINGEKKLIPMVTEEPSVIAAANNGAKILGNITTAMKTRLLTGQIVFTNVEEAELKRDLINQKSQTLLESAKNYCQSMVKRGGGPQKLWAEIKEEFLIVYLNLDSCDAMGANVMNTTLEGIAPEIQEIVGAEFLMAILSNYGEFSLVKARASVSTSALNQKYPDLAEKITQASRLAQVDPYRAATHNKGIMNGVDAVVVATGNDWRAVESAAHSYASRNGSYQGLSQWWIEEDKLIGEIEIPIQVGTVGGTLSNHPLAQWSLELMENPDAKGLSQIIGAVGLAQNFAALRALVTDGIQKGHMALQANSLAMQVGASPSEAEIISEQLKKENNITSQRAKFLLDELRKKERR